MDSIQREKEDVWTGNFERDTIISGLYWDIKKGYLYRIVAERGKQENDYIRRG